MTVRKPSSRFLACGILPSLVFSWLNQRPTQQDMFATAGLPQ